MTPSPASSYRAADYSGRAWDVTVRRLSSGYFHIRGNGPCNWAQPPVWPCDETTLREHAFPEASESFLTAVVRLAIELDPTLGERSL